MTWHIEEFILSLADKSPHTRRAYQVDVQALTAWALRGEADSPSDLDHPALRRFLSFQRTLGRSERSVARRAAGIRAYFAWLAKTGKIDSDPAANLRAPANTQRLPSVPKEIEAEYLLDEAAERVRSTSISSDQADQVQRARLLMEHAILELLYGAGLRVSELCGLDWQDYDARNRTLTVLGKGSKYRRLPLHQAACGSLEKYLDEGRPHLDQSTGGRAVFLNRTAKRMNPRDVRRILGKYPLPDGRVLHPHQWRHAFATHLLRGGADVRVVQELLGHADVETTQLYTHLTKDHVRSVYEATHPRA
ncbi:MAG: tyrosine-type recombinase/integrase [Acidimicrobiia bacterium]|jgi:site-specific recombinase XerD|nr:tyrosine-type recombinase/integrase [Acidimicrobiia bacterium]MBP8181210.1 tyrosine-type recombinase/integrase [Acidimicrobiia bacterium]